jgi:hypothetical protein
MTRVLYRISRAACPATDRPWLDALFAEAGTVESGRDRLLWLLGALGLLVDRQARRLDPRLLIAAACCLALSLTSAAFWFTGYEGLTGEDDYSIAGTAVFVAALISLTALQFTRPFPKGETL